MEECLQIPLKCYSRLIEEHIVLKIEVIFIYDVQEENCNVKMVVFLNPSFSYQDEHFSQFECIHLIKKYLKLVELV